MYLLFGFYESQYRRRFLLTYTHVYSSLRIHKHTHLRKTKTTYLKIHEAITGTSPSMDTSSITKTIASSSNLEPNSRKYKRPCQVDGTIGLMTFTVASHFTYQPLLEIHFIFLVVLLSKWSFMHKLNLGPSSIQKFTNPVQLELLFNIFIPT